MLVTKKQPGRPLRSLLPILPSRLLAQLNLCPESLDIVISVLMDTVLWLVWACRPYPSVYRVSSQVRCARESAALPPSCRRLMFRDA